MSRYLTLILILSTFSCKINRPENAAKEYCECLQNQYRGKIDTLKAFYLCDSIAITRYNELNTYYRDKDANLEKWDSAVKFHSRFVEYRTHQCCVFMGNCDTFSFRDSLIKHFGSYFSRDGRPAMDLIKSIVDSCGNGNIHLKYDITSYEELISLSENGKDSSQFYYEIVIFKNMESLSSLIRLMGDDSCLQRNFDKIIFYKHIDERKLLLCTYYNFDFEKMKQLLNRTFRGDSVMSREI